MASSGYCAWPGVWTSFHFALRLGFGLERGFGAIELTSLQGGLGFGLDF